MRLDPNQFPATVAVKLRPWGWVAGQMERSAALGWVIHVVGEDKSLVGCAEPVWGALKIRESDVEMVVPLPDDPPKVTLDEAERRDLVEAYRKPGPMRRRPERSTAALAEYSPQWWALNFLEQRTTRRDGAPGVLAAVLHRTYREWAEKHGHPALERPALAKLCNSLGWRRDGLPGSVRWASVVLDHGVAPADAEPEAME